ncbi:hypothetical protein LPJ66_008385, partial [Kickxella alabastrina]
MTLLLAGIVAVAVAVAVVVSVVAVWTLIVLRVVVLVIVLASEAVVAALVAAVLACKVGRKFGNLADNSKKLASGVLGNGEAAAGGDDCRLDDVVELASESCWAISTSEQEGGMVENVVACTVHVVGGVCSEGVKSTERNVMVAVEHSLLRFNRLEVRVLVARVAVLEANKFSRSYDLRVVDEVSKFLRKLLAPGIGLTGFVIGIFPSNLCSICHALGGLDVTGSELCLELLADEV